ncbi:toprim domain-containing protein [Metamycoplasma buccale]|uniref:toprim domain-containing protein n=1 Tax=Metamycoplasma buccale TaxID=55602 RepID=UPI00398E34AC
MNDQIIEELSKKIKSACGLSKKQIEKTILFLLNSDQAEIDKGFLLIKELKSKIRKCQKCNNFSNNDICDICLDKTRENKLMIVEHYQNISKFEELNIYKGHYFILEGLYKLKNNDQVVLSNLEKLISMSKEYDEIILALSSDIEGQFTMQYIQKLLRDKNKNINVYQLSIGIPMGAEIEYVDPTTLKQSLINKAKM